MNVPFFRPQLTEQEIDEVVATLRSGWLTSGPRVQRFETEFAAAVRATHAGGAETHARGASFGCWKLSVYKPGQGVLVPTMTFAATAEVVRYLGGIPIWSIVDPLDVEHDLEDAARKAGEQSAKGKS